MRRPFSLLIKPASADCNLKCSYCFYLEKWRLYPESKMHRMTPDTQEKMIAGYMKTEQPNYAFGWQGGEPTLMGVDFFRRATDLQKKYGRAGSSVANGLQTNGTLIDDEMARHFGEYKFLLGVSLDGPPEIHDHYRKTIGGQGSHSLVTRGIEALKRNSVEFNILVLVNDINVKRPKEIYNYFLDQGFHYLQFIPCVEFDAEAKPFPYTVNGREWGEFLCEIFDLWYKTDTRKVSIRFFDTILNLLVDGVRNVCHIGRNCCQYFVVETNGDIYPCDFFVTEELRLGNVATDDWYDLQEKSETYKEFGKRKAIWNRACDTCEFLHYCSGDCLKNRIYGNITDPRNLSHLCEGWKIFLQHSLPGFKKIADQIRRERERALALRQARQNPFAPPVETGRNDPCPCGSGKKYKKCCMNR